jgi:hypothetical protein
MLEQNGHEPFSDRDGDSGFRVRSAAGVGQLIVVVGSRSERTNLGSDGGGV